MGVNDVSGWRLLYRRAYRKVIALLKHGIGLRLFLVQLGDDFSTVKTPTLEPGYRTLACEPKDLLQWIDNECGLSAEFLHAAIERGDRCVANYFHNKLVGYVFVARRQAPLSGQLEVRLSNRLIYRYKAWTHPNHRRKHLSMARGRLNKTLFPLEPGQRTVAYVDTTNFASKLVRPEIQPEKIGYCGYVVLAGREIAFNGAGPVRHGFKLQRIAP